MEIDIYQICYEKDQLSSIDPAFIPYDNTANEHPELREFWIFLNFYKTGKYGEVDYCGAVSHKFSRKAKITGQEFVEFIRNNPGHDVYFVNPFPQLSYYSFNVWEHGESKHPGLMRLAQNVFDRVGYRINVFQFPRNNADTLLYCNFWVGNAKFWREYMNFALPIFEEICKMPKNERKKYFVNAPHFKYAPYFAFLFERLFSTLLIYNKNKIAALAYPHS